MAPYSLNDQVAALQRHDYDAFASFYAPDATVADPQYPEPLRGREAIKKDMADFVRAFPDLSFKVESSLQEGDNLAFEATGTGTHKGPLTGPAGEIPATNRSVKMRMAIFARLSGDGQIVAERRYYDLAGMLQQLGIGG